MTPNDTDIDLSILLADGSLKMLPNVREAIDALPDDSCSVQKIKTYSEAVQTLSQASFDLMLLNHQTLEDSSGIDTLKTLVSQFQRLPIIVFGDKEDPSHICEVIKHGAQDYLPESQIDPQILLRSIITAVERNKALQKIRHSEEKFRTVVQNLEESYYEVDLRGNCTYANMKAISRLGYTPEEIIGMNNREYTSPETARKISEIFKTVYETGKSARTDDYEVITKEGRRLVLELSVSLLRDINGTPIGFNGISRDITLPVEALKKLKQSEEKYRTILESMEDGYFEVDLEGRLTFYNDAMAGMFGCGPEELLLLDNRKYMDPKNAQKVFKAYNRVYQTGKPNRSFQYEIIRFDGVKRNMESTISLLKTEDDKIIGFRGVIRDITGRRQVVEELARAKAKAEAADQSKSNFLANMSHEIRTPMNGVIGMLTLLQDTQLSPEQTDFVKTGKQSADSLLTVINDILDFSKIEAGKLDIENIDFDLRKTIEDMVAMPALMAQSKKLKYIYQIDHQVPSLLRGDPGRLRQIILNLSTNAIKFTKKGEIVFRILLEKETAKRVTLRFSVKDTGIGISKKEQEQLFRSFQQVDTSTTRKYGGTGLGLAISKQLVQLMNGKIGVESEKGEGAEFWFTATLNKQKKQSDVFPKIVRTLEGKRILVIDDNQTSLNIITENLERWGCFCSNAMDGLTALSKLQAAVKKGTPYDIVFCDMIMPRMDGVQLGKKIKADPALADTHIIMLTSQGLRGDTEKVKQIGYSAYLTKPISPSMLFDCLITVLNNFSDTLQKKEKAPIITKHSLAETRRQRIRILLVEDNAVNRKLALLLLKRFGFSADEVVNGKEAIKILEKSPYDIVLMDIQMPKMDGLEATRVIRDPGSTVLNHNVRIIAMTAHAMKEDRERCLKAGMNDYITKPIQPDTFLKAIEGQIKTVING